MQSVSLDWTASDERKISQVIVVEGRMIQPILNVTLMWRPMKHEVLPLMTRDIERIQRLHELHGVIVFTDPDFNGERIRRMIMTGHSNCAACLSPSEMRLFPNQVKGRSLGIEHASYEDLKAALAQVTEQFENKNEFDISRGDLIR